MLPCPTSVHVQGNTAVQGCYHVKHGTVHVQGDTAVQGSNMVPFTLKEILQPRSATMSNIRRNTAFQGCYHVQHGTVQGITAAQACYHATWYRSRFVCFLDFAPGVSPRRKRHFVRKMAKIKSASQAALNTAIAQIIGKNQWVQGYDQ